MYLNAVSTSYDWLLQSSQSASDALKQGMFNNMWRQAGTSLPSMLNDPAQVAEVTALAAEGQAAAQANTSNSVMSLLGQEVIPHMRNWIEAILYAMFPVIVILMVVMTSDGAKKVLGGYMMSLAWIGMWPVLFAVINHLSLMYLKHKANALGLAPGVPFPLSARRLSMSRR
jgi:conjugal transfer mating pair stabilization protein TraG